MNFPNVLANAKNKLHPSESIKGSVHMLGRIPVGEPRRENEFGSAIISLLDLGLSRPTMLRPEYRSLLISCLLHLCHSSS